MTQPTKNRIFHSIERLFPRRSFCFAQDFRWKIDLEFHVLDLSQFMVKWKKYRREIKRAPEWPWLTMLSAVDNRTKVVDEEMLHELEELARSEQEILEALEEWESLSVDPENRYAYECKLSFYPRIKRLLFCKFLRNVPLPFSETVC
ncbi:hypothetical protein GGR02_002204 [Anoxybacillus voinovskiensis]|uniref:Uncharacterized protein n=1 Tax=Anoxybacteroides voinovskiense TaxID=230470 RepID=A0A840DVJ6_9BACL|nr:hypothetical protein [Anoxybacillus voinovskiensis]MBB4074437.1 hypothetical protein [Anoxybacillus voinovskiensis]